MDGRTPLPALAEQLKSHGFAIRQILDQINCIIGTGTDDVAQQVRRLPGVADVSPDADMQLPPPESPLTW